MIWFVVCFAVVIAALVMWDGIAPTVEGALRGTSIDAPHTPSLEPLRPELPTRTPVGPLHWTLITDSRNFRASREFLNPIVAGQARYYPPVLYLSCYEAKAYAWLDTPLRALAAKSHPEAVAVRINDGATEFWPRGSRNRLIVPSPERLLRALSIGTSLTLSLAFEEAPEQTMHLGTDGFGMIAAEMAACGGAVAGRR
jgi:hypothetical protein